MVRCDLLYKVFDPIDAFFVDKPVESCVDWSLYTNGVQLLERAYPAHAAGLRYCLEQQVCPDGWTIRHSERFWYRHMPERLFQPKIGVIDEVLWYKLPLGLGRWYINGQSRMYDSIEQATFALGLALRDETI